MTRYLIRQLLLSLIKLLIFITIVFFLVQAVMPGDFVDQFAMFTTPEEREQLREQLGLNLSLIDQYLTWMLSVFQGDLGTSFRGQTVSLVFQDAVPLTVLVFFTGLLLAFVIGYTLGKAAAWRGPGIFSTVSTLAGIMLFTSFPPWLAWLVGIFLLTQVVASLPSAGISGISASSSRINLSSDVWRNSSLSHAQVASRVVVGLAVGLLLFLLLRALLNRIVERRVPSLLLILPIAAAVVGSWYALGMQAQAFDLVTAALIPAITFTLLSFGETMLVMRATMGEVLDEQYVQTARAKGIPTQSVRDKHAARNAILPVLSRWVISLPYLLTAVVIVEYSLDWPGIGTAIFNALYWQDMPLVMGGLLVVGVLTLAGRLILDVAHAYLDPRIRYDQVKPSTS